MGNEAIVERCFRSISAAATEALGEAIGRRVRPGTVIALSGELGSGKTCFVRGLARGMDVTDAVSSPTYTLMHAYNGRLPLYHFDAWMEGREKALFLDGGDEWLHGDGVGVVEWAERVLDWLPEGRLEMELSHLSEQERALRLRVRPGGADPGGLRELLCAMDLPEGLLEVEIPPEKG